VLDGTMLGKELLDSEEVTAGELIAGTEDVEELSDEELKTKELLLDDMVGGIEVSMVDEDIEPVGDAIVLAEEDFELAEDKTDVVMVEDIRELDELTVLHFPVGEKHKVSTIHFTKLLWVLTVALLARLHIAVIWCR
jgi:hypothetical protein